MSEYMRIRNWEKYQGISMKNANFVKIQTSIIIDMEFNALPVTERLCFFYLLCYAGVNGNKFRLDSNALSRFCHMQEEPDINLMIESGLIEEWSEEKSAQVSAVADDTRRKNRERQARHRSKLKGANVTVTALSRSGNVTSRGGNVTSRDVTPTETETETETEKEKEKPIAPTALSTPPQPKSQKKQEHQREVIDWWNSEVASLSDRFTKIRVMSKNKWERFLKASKDGFWDSRDAIVAKIKTSPWLIRPKDDYKLSFEKFLGKNKMGEVIWEKTLEDGYADDRDEQDPYLGGDISDGILEDL